MPKANAIFLLCFTPGLANTICLQKVEINFNGGNKGLEGNNETKISKIVETSDKRVAEKAGPSKVRESTQEPA